jgi:hypothetical protein
MEVKGRLWCCSRIVDFAGDGRRARRRKVVVFCTPGLLVRRSEGKMGGIRTSFQAFPVH